MTPIPFRTSPWLILAFPGLFATPGVAAAQSVFSSEDRAGLKIGADSIRHISIGFALPTPAKNLIPYPALEQRAAAVFGGQLPPELAEWAFQDTTQHVDFIISVIGMPGLNEEKFRNYSRGMREGLSKLRLVVDTTIWQSAQRETRFVAQHPNGGYVGTRCVPSLKPRREYILCVQTFSAEPTTLAKVGGGLTVY